MIQREPGSPESTQDVEPEASPEAAPYLTLAQNAAVGLWHIDAEGRTRYANPAMIELLQVGSLDAVIGAHFSEFFTPAALAIVRAEHMKRAQGLSSSYEASVLGRNGREVEVVISGSPLMDSKGKMCGMIGSFLQVTNLREAERALRDSQAMLRAAMESLPFDFWAIGSDGRYCLQNSVAKARWGDQIGKRPEETGLAPELLAIWMENNRRALSGELVRGEVAFRVAKELRHVENILAPIRDGDEVRGLLGVNIDITPRKLAEQARREAHATLQSFFDHSTALVFLKDSQGRYTMVNRQFERSFGLTREEALGRTDAELFQREQATMFMANDRKVLAAGAEMEFEEIAHYTNGLRTNLVLKFPVRDEHGAIVGIGGVASDVTERRAAEQARRRADERYRVLVENARDVIFTLSPNGEISSVNPACEAVSGWNSADWLGKDFRPLISDEDRPLAVERFNEALCGKQPAPYELRACRKGGGMLTVEVTLTPIMENGQVVYVLGIARDVTERRQLETQLRQVQKMESIGQLAGGVAHDFNNILTVIQGHAALMSANDGLSREVRDSITQIAQAADRAANLTRQLLAFSRRQLLKPQALDLNEVVADMSNMLRRILGEDILLEVRPARTLPSVQGDPGMIEQVIMNLAVNARDAMPGGGRLTISTDVCDARPPEAVTPNERLARPCVCLCVTDTGSGIKPEHLPRIFEPFFTTKGVGQGTGLGLATVYGIVHQHHGWITVESGPRHGTTFRVHFPAQSESPDFRKQPEAPNATPQRGSERILVVEDEASVRFLVCSVLRRFGYEVVEARSGVEALDLWRTNRGTIDLVLTDIVMPGGMNGRQLAEWLQGDEPDLPVIYTSGYAAEAVSGEMHFRDGENFLQKPYPPKTLADLIRRTLDARKPKASSPK